MVRTRNPAAAEEDLVEFYGAGVGVGIGSVVGCWSEDAF